MLDKRKLGHLQESRTEKTICKWGVSFINQRPTSNTRNDRITKARRACQVECSSVFCIVIFLYALMLLFLSTQLAQPATHSPTNPQPTNQIIQVLSMCVEFLYVSARLVWASPGRFGLCAICVSLIADSKVL